MQDGHGQLRRIDALIAAPGVAKAVRSSIWFGGQMQAPGVGSALLRGIASRSV